MKIVTKHGFNVTGHCNTERNLSISALTTVPIKAAPNGDRVGEAQRQCLQSTIRSNMKAGWLESPRDSPVLPENRGRLMEKVSY